MTPLPKQAEVIAKAIREQVPRPNELPMFYLVSDAKLKLRFNHKCPMGFLQNAKHVVPSSANDFIVPPGNDEEIIAFATWWDSQTDPQAAVNAVWGEQ